MKCQRCGAEIPPKRLRAMPRATRCVPCQELHDEPVQPYEISGALAVDGELDGEMIRDIARGLERN